MPVSVMLSPSSLGASSGASWWLAGAATMLRSSSGKPQRRSAPSASAAAFHDGGVVTRRRGAPWSPAGVIGDAVIGTAEDQHLHQFVEHHPVWNVHTVAAERLGHPASWQQRGELLPDRLDDRCWDGGLDPLDRAREPLRVDRRTYQAPRSSTRLSTQTAGRGPVHGDWTSQHRGGKSLHGAGSIELRSLPEIRSGSR